MGKVTTTIMVCDRCGSQHAETPGPKETEWGHLSVKWDGHKAGRTFSGDVGGISIKGESWLCLSCASAFEAFMAPTAEGE